MVEVVFFFFVPISSQLLFIINPGYLGYISYVLPSSYSDKVNYLLRPTFIISCEVFSLVKGMALEVKIGFLP